MRNDDHLTDELLVMAIDDELPEPKAASAALHLSTCDECKQKYEQLAGLSSQLE
jgi:anti-sigma factor RsiW